jgi:hypothetical protein
MAGVQARFPSLVSEEEPTPLFTYTMDWGRVCSEIIPFKLDLDNSSERTSCFLIPFPRPDVLTFVALRVLSQDVY